MFPNDNDHGRVAFLSRKADTDHCKWTIEVMELESNEVIGNFVVLPDDLLHPAPVLSFSRPRSRTNIEAYSPLSKNIHIYISLSIYNLTNTHQFKQYSMH